MASSKQKVVTTPDLCPRCKKGSIRVKVNLYLDIPLSLMNRLSKRNLRSRDVKVEGANWPEELLYCTNHKCGMMKRGTP